MDTRTRRSPLPLTLLLSLLLLQVAMQVAEMRPQQSTSQTSQQTFQLVRLRSSLARRRPECGRLAGLQPPELPRRQEDLPQVILTGRVRDLQPEDPSTAMTQQQQQQPQTSRALVQVVRVLRGNKQLAGGELLVSGLPGNQTQPSGCPQANQVKLNDTLIWLLQPSSSNLYQVSQNYPPLAMNLNNLDRLIALSQEEPLKRRGPIEDILCEAHYCPYGRCQVNERTNQTACHCPDSCPSPLVNQAPLCGSDNQTYATECHLIREGCRLRRPLFQTREAAC